MYVAATTNEEVLLARGILDPIFDDVVRQHGEECVHADRFIEIDVPPHVAARLVVLLSKWWMVVGPENADFSVGEEFNALLHELGFRWGLPAGPSRDGGTILAWELMHFRSVYRRCTEALAREEARKFIDDDPCALSIQLPQACTIDDAIQLLGIPEGKKAAFRAAVGRHARRDSAIRVGDIPNAPSRASRVLYDGPSLQRIGTNYRPSPRTSPNLFPPKSSAESSSRTLGKLNAR